MSDLFEPPPEDQPASAVPAVDQPSHPLGAPAARSELTAAFAGFYRDEVTELVRFLLYMGAGLADAADLAQETMIDVYKSWASIEYPRAWARRVASRKFGRRMASVEAPVAQTDGSPLLPAHRDVAEWEQRHEVLRLLATLPWRQRQVMAWTFDGYQPHEIALELNISADAVRASLKLARRAGRPGRG